MTNRLAAVSLVTGIAGGVVSALIGSWDLALETLCIIMLLDYMTGMIVAGVFKKSPKSDGGALDSKAAFKGLVKKSLIIFLVIAFHQADKLTDKSYFRDGACWAFFVAEMISVIENVGLVYPLPAFVSKALDWFRKKGEDSNDKEARNG